MEEIKSPIQIHRCDKCGGFLMEDTKTRSSDEKYRAEKCKNCGERYIIYTPQTN